MFHNPELMLEPLLWFQLIFLGAMCNLFFFLGPAFEAYGRYFGMWSRIMSPLLLISGLIFTGAFATLFLIVRSK